MSGIGILLVNTGSPETTNVEDIKKYLFQFLMDPHIVNLPSWFWKPFLKYFLLPFRSPVSSRKYQSIWGPFGSPLTSTTYTLATLVEKKLNNLSDTQFFVLSAMRYGKPSISNQIEELVNKQVDRIITLPLFPQTSFSTTESIRDEINQISTNVPILFINGYFQHPAYQEALITFLKQQLNNQPNSGKILFSFHGLPQKYIENENAYDKQCKQTVAFAAKALGLSEKSWDIGYQSKFGPGKWTQPSTVKLLKEYPKNGIDTVQVVCPGFAVDCLETLHEIEIEMKDIFFKSGGKSFRYIPALNADHAHCNALVNIIRTKLSE